MTLCTEHTAVSIDCVCSQIDTAMTLISSLNAYLPVTSETGSRVFRTMSRRVFKMYQRILIPLINNNNKGSLHSARFYATASRGAVHLLLPDCFSCHGGGSRKKKTASSYAPRFPMYLHRACRSRSGSRYLLEDCWKQILRRGPRLLPLGAPPLRKLGNRSSDGE